MKTEVDHIAVKPNTLYIVATPLGNARDITLRALDVLAQVDRIAAEDTRVTVDLLRTHALPHKPLMSVREHNEREGAAQVVHYLSSGESVAYVSDAGTPGISDPGAKLVSAVREAGFTVVPVPGASAITALLSVAGIAETAFLFAGFLPPTAQARNAAIAVFAIEPRAIVFYESTHRLAETLDTLGTHCGARALLIGKELTKTFETIVKIPAAQSAAWLAADGQRVRGEFVLVLCPLAEEAIAPQVVEAQKWLAALAKELPPARAAKIVAQMTGVSRDALYRSLNQRDNRDDGA
jgi:16S rRNA (cytidine1402-2'-O)-methyltransferase